MPARPIGSRTPESGLGVFNMTRQAINARWIDPLNFKRYSDLEWLLDRVAEIPLCDNQLGVRELPLDCYEYAETPRDLLANLMNGVMIQSLYLMEHHGGCMFYNTSWDNRLNQEAMILINRFFLKLCRDMETVRNLRAFLVPD